MYSLSTTIIQNQNILRKLKNENDRDPMPILSTTMIIKEAIEVNVAAPTM